MDEQFDSRYLAASTVIDFRNSAVERCAAELGQEADNAFTVVRRCFEWVSDRVPHSLDQQNPAVTCSASEVLAQGHGLCFAKAHLLAALLRANGIPAGLDYQRLQTGAGGYTLHGLNTVWLAEHGWLRLDARGRPGSPTKLEEPANRKVYPANLFGEIDYRLNLAEPLPEVVAVLRRGTTVHETVAQVPRSVRMG